VTGVMTGLRGRWPIWGIRSAIRQLSLPKCMARPRSASGLMPVGRKQSAAMYRTHERSPWPSAHPGPHIEDLQQAPAKPATADQEMPFKHEAVSLLHLRYFPRVGDLSNAVVCEPVISPLSSVTGIVEETLSGIGRVEFAVTRWEECQPNSTLSSGCDRCP
jgi:hypothetical protein